MALTGPVFNYPEIVLGCDSKFSVGLIQNRHTDLISSKVCVRSWRGCQLGVCKCHEDQGGGMEEGGVVIGEVGRRRVAWRWMSEAGGGGM